MLANGTAAGGQLTTTTDVENFPGFPDGVGGSELMESMRKQSARFGTEIITETISKLDLSQRPFKLWTEYNDGPDNEPAHTADAVIIATGANARRLDLPGEEKYWQNGISACAVCDGAVPIFRNKPLYVIGGGDSAAEEAMFLAKYGSEVTVLVRRDKLRASKAMANRLLAHPKVTVRFNAVATEVLGDNKPRGLMTNLRVKDTNSGQEEVVPANGLFYAVGHDPANALVKDQIDLDEDGYVITKPGTSYTSLEGVFACGDVQDKRYRQAVTSAGMSSPFICQFQGMHTNNTQDPAVSLPWRPKSSSLNRNLNLLLRMRPRRPPRLKSPPSSPPHRRLRAARPRTLRALFLSTSKTRFSKCLCPYNSVLIPCWFLSYVMIVIVFLLDFLFSAFHFRASALCQHHWASGRVCVVQTPDSHVYRDRNDQSHYELGWHILVIHFVLFMLRIVTNNLVILASAASQPPYENNVPCNFQGVPGQASLLSVHYIC